MKVYDNFYENLMIKTTLISPNYDFLYKCIETGPNCKNASTLSAHCSATVGSMEKNEHILEVSCYYVYENTPSYRLNCKA